MDPHNDFDKHDRPPVLCRCGHERDDHGSRIEMRDGQKMYVQKCEHCPCENFLDVAGPLWQMLKDIPVYPTAIHFDLDGPAGGARACNQAKPRTAQGTGTLSKCPDAIAIEVARRVAELPDRTSPADWPEAMLVTSAELQFIVTDEINESVQADRLGAQEIEARFSELISTELEHYAQKVAKRLLHKALSPR